MTAPAAVRRLGTGDLAGYRALNALFAQGFDDPEAYASHPPSDSWAESQLANPQTVLLIAERGDAPVGALAAYELRKFEQERRELYIYDLAVVEAHRRQGVATALIDELRRHARAIGAWVVYVQADHGDPPAIALYDKLGRREDVLHFDIDP